MPALAIEMVCCSIASWMATWSARSILSNSSIAQIPLSANIRAPASMVNSPDSSSLTTAAVRPAADEAFPEVYTARGKKPQTYLGSGESSCESHSLQELGLACRRVPDDANVDVTSQMNPFLGLLVHSAHQLQQDTLLDDLMTCESAKLRSICTHHRQSERYSTLNVGRCSACEPCSSTRPPLAESGY